MEKWVKIFICVYGQVRTDVVMMVMVIMAVMLVAGRLEICRDCRDGQLFKIFVSRVKFPR